MGPGALVLGTRGRWQLPIPVPRSVIDLHGAFSLAVRSRDLKSFSQAWFSDTGVEGREGQGRTLHTDVGSKGSTLVECLQHL